MQHLYDRRKEGVIDVNCHDVILETLKDVWGKAITKSTPFSDIVMLNRRVKATLPSIKGGGHIYHVRRDKDYHDTLHIQIVWQNGNEVEVKLVLEE